MHGTALLPCVMSLKMQVLLGSGAEALQTGFPEAPNSLAPRPYKVGFASPCREPVASFTRAMIPAKAGAAKEVPPPHVAAPFRYTYCCRGCRLPMQYQAGRGRYSAAHPIRRSA